MEKLLKLTLEERILMYSLQPEKGSFELLSAFKILENNIKFTESETRKYDIKTVKQPNPATGQEQMMVAFNKEAAHGYTKDCKVPARMLSYYAEKLEELETKGELTFQFMGLYDRCVLGNEPKEEKDGTDSSEQSEGDNE